MPFIVCSIYSPPEILRDEFLDLVLLETKTIVARLILRVARKRLAGVSNHLDASRSRAGRAGTQNVVFEVVTLQTCRMNIDVTMLQSVSQKNRGVFT